MPYHSVAEIFEDLDKTRSRLQRGVEGLSAAQQNFRPVPEAWSIAEIMEHLSIIEQNLAQLIGMLVKKAEAAGNVREGDAAQFAPVSIESYVESSLTQKFKAPEVAHPTGSVSVADSLARMSATRAAMRELRPGLERVDGTVLKYPHPGFGPLDLYQWLAFIGAHEERHLRQIDAVKGSEGFETAGTQMHV